jgi:hypothetical protein
MNATTFRHPANRDAAWGRYYARHGLAPATRGCRTLSNAERLAAWAARYYPLPADIRHHSKAGTGAPAVRSIPLRPAPQRAAPGSVSVTGHYFEGVDPADLPDSHPDSLHYAGF